MNRTILFRGREYYTDEWVYGYLIEDDEGLCIAKYEKERDVERRHAIDPNTVGQFSGLLDKDGNRIFEGDICSARVQTNETGFDGCYLSTTVRGAVIFEDCSYWLKVPHCIIGMGKRSDLKVRGNVFDHPHLLNKTSNQ